MRERDAVRRVGDRVRAAREAKGWSQTELARRAGLNKETVNRMELGGNAWVATVYKVAEALDVPPNAVFHDAEFLRRAGETHTAEIAARIDRQMAVAPVARRDKYDAIADRLRALDLSEKDLATVNTFIELFEARRPKRRARRTA